MLKKILLTVASIFLATQTYSILLHIDQFKNDSIALIFFTAWVINLFITGIFAFAGFAFPTQKLLPTPYYNIWFPNALKKIYKLLQVDLFRKVLLLTLWKNKSRRMNYFNGKKNGILNLSTQSKKSEFGHLIPLIFITIVSIYLYSLNLFMLGSCTLTINFIGNFYPIILQRHHRMRIENIRKRF